MNLCKLVISFACVLFSYNLYAQNQASVSVHFGFNKYNVSESDLAALENFKSTHPNIESVIIDGYADTVGSDKYNYALSVRRCNAVKTALGYDEKKTEVIIKVTAHGEKDLLFTTNDENRVAIVSVNEKKPVAVQEAPKPEPVKDTVVQAPPPVDTTPVATAQPEPVTDTISLIPKELGNDEEALIKQLMQSKVGESVVLSELHFARGRHVFLKTSQPALTAMLDALKKLPTLELEVQGHICCDDILAVDGFDIDTKEFKLSYNRAKAVFDYMVDKGIDSSRLVYKGFGTRKRLVYPEQTDDDRNKNRRVEFVITKK